MAALRYLLRTDLYFLLRYGFNRPDVERPWLLARCKEVQAAPDGYLDLWSREHYKSTIITYALTIQDILAGHGEWDNPDQKPAKWRGREPTFGIFSYIRPAAKAFLNQIKEELEGNTMLKSLFPDVLYADPKGEAPSWGLDGGITVKRKSNPKEATVEAWGIVEGQPTGRHFVVRIYDDVVSRDYVRTPEMIKNTTEAWELSLNLGVEGGFERYIGTRYHFFDTYRTILQRDAAAPRVYPATDDGQFDGKPVLWSEQYLRDRIRRSGPYVAACQLMQNPKAATSEGFQREWIRHHTLDVAGGWKCAKRMNRYLLVDPANEKKKTSDRTAMIVLGLAEDQNLYLLDAVWDKLSLDERTDAIFFLHRKWRPKKVGYEKYGKDADIDHIRYVQEQDNYRFDIVPMKGPLGQMDRIKRLVPDSSQHRVYIPKQLWKTDYEGDEVELIERFLVEEYDPFPVGHTDLFDIMSRIKDRDFPARWPKLLETPSEERYGVRGGEQRRERYGKRDNRSWLSG